MTDDVTALPLSEDRAVVNGAASVSAVPASIPSAWLILPNDNYAIRMEVKEYCLDFCVYAAAESYAIGSDVGVWTLFDGSECHEFTEFEQAEWEMRGFLKWDGCINWETNQSCMMHGCGPSYVDEIRNIFAAVYSFGKRYFDMLGDEPPAMPDGAFVIITAQGMAARSDATGPGAAVGNSPVGATDAPKGGIHDQ